MDKMKDKMDEKMDRLKRINLQTFTFSDILKLTTMIHEVEKLREREENLIESIDNLIKKYDTENLNVN